MLSLLDLTFTALAAALWYVWPDLGLAPLAWVASGRIVRLVALPSPTWRRTAFDLPLLALLLSAFVASFLAYSPALAQTRLWYILAGLFLYDSLAFAPSRVRFGRLIVAPVPIFIALLPAVMALYFMTTVEWTRWTGKLPALDPLLYWFASWQPNVAGRTVHPNIAGGLIAAALPLQIAALMPWLKPLSLRRRGVAGGLVAVSLMGLLFSLSRGAWMALVVAAIAGAAHVYLRRRGLHALGAAVLLIVATGGATVLAGIVLAPDFLERAGAVLGPSSGVMSRLATYRGVVALALDYPFTGAGLGSFEMAYSSYVVLLHVGFLQHGHNLFLDVWIEQGIIGLLALTWLIASVARTIWLRPLVVRSVSATGALRLAAYVGVGVMLLHGLVDDGFYATRAAIFMFVPLAILSRTLPAQLASHPSVGAITTTPRAQYTSPPSGGGFWGVRLAISFISMAALLVLLLLPTTRAAFQANLGALLQTRAELLPYRWPDWPIQDALRRAQEINLSPAIARYTSALALDPANVTANRRLGQIALSRGDYGTAWTYLETAYASAPAQRATRQMLGELYAADGDIARAAELWRTVDLSAGQLDGRRWWYDHIGDPARAAAIAAASRGLDLGQMTSANSAQ